jgi:shikimate kinase
MTAISPGYPRASPTDPRGHLILVGLPGAGKSTVGAAVAAKLGREFLDLDQEIERRESATVSAIFAEKGEHFFRQRERELTEELRSKGNMVIAPGGGWITNPDVMALLRPPGRIIYLRVKPETALGRLGADAASRPLLTRPDPAAELRRLLAEREPLYQQADHVIDTERLTVDQVVDEVLKVIRSPSLR